MYLAGMSRLLHSVAQTLYSKESFDAVTEPEADRLAQRYPYFIPAQLLQHLKQTESGASADAQRLVLFYPDPLLANFQLHELRESASAEQEPAIITIESEVDQPSQYSNLPSFSSSEVNTVEIDTTPSEPFRQPDEQPLFTPDQKPSETEEELAETIEVPAAEEVAYELVVENAVVESEVIVENDLVKVEALPPTSSPEIVHGTAPIILGTTVVETPAVPATEATLAAPIEGLAFEPYHTVDYFASQGIKIRSEEAPTDKLGKQLKSFTQWLKTMKRLPVADLTNPAETPADKTVTFLATESLQGTEVVTEAMAEVWARQGAHQKAVETYRKLSLLYPAKSAYFALKIENLNRL